MNIFEWTTAWGVLLWAVVGSVSVLVLGLSFAAVHRGFLSNLLDHRRELARVDLHFAHDLRQIQQPSNET